MTAAVASTRCQYWVVSTPSGGRSLPPPRQTPVEADFPRQADPQQGTWYQTGSDIIPLERTWDQTGSDIIPLPTPTNPPSPMDRQHLRKHYLTLRSVMKKNGRRGRHTSLVPLDLQWAKSLRLQYCK